MHRPGFEFPDLSLHLNLPDHRLPSNCLMEGLFQVLLLLVEILAIKLPVHLIYITKNCIIKFSVERLKYIINKILINGIL